MDIKIIGTLCVAAALLLDISSYWKQIAKILKTKKSSQVSSSSYVYRIGKASCSITGLAIYSNYAGLTMEIVMLLVYSISLYIICKYKPKGWRLFH